MQGKLVFLAAGNTLDTINQLHEFMVHVSDPLQDLRDDGYRDR